MCFSVQLFFSVDQFHELSITCAKKDIINKKDYNNLKHKIRLKILKLHLLSKKLLKT